MLEEFLDSNCDLFDSRDFYYYAEQTGKPVSWLLSNANFTIDMVDKLHNSQLDNDWEMIDLIQTHFY
jgi:hypothetical protein